MNASSPWIELRNMEARGEITAEEHARAKELLAEELKKAKPSLFDRLYGEAIRTPRWQNWAGMILVILGLYTCGKVASSPETFSMEDAVLERYGRGRIVTQAEYGDQWPFPSHEQAILRCKMLNFGAGTTSRPFVTMELGGKIYGLNGVALGKMKTPRPDHLFARDQFGGPELGATGEMINRAVATCL